MKPTTPCSLGHTRKRDKRGDAYCSICKNNRKKEYIKLNREKYLEQKKKYYRSNQKQYSAYAKKRYTEKKDEITIKAKTIV
jgi:hypothetical protein